MMYRYGTRAGYILSCSLCPAFFCRDCFDRLTNNHHRNRREASRWKAPTWMREFNCGYLFIPGDKISDAGKIWMVRLRVDLNAARDAGRPFNIPSRPPPQAYKDHYGRTRA